MKKKIIAAVSAVIAAVSLLAVGNGTVNNTVANHWDSLGNVRVYYGSTGQYSRWLSPGTNTSNNAQCFYPTQDSHSQWGGLYRAYEVRCFTTNNNYLFLHVGR